MSLDATPPPPARESLSARTTPTWEMELLISGATVFGLVQLPGIADKFLFHLHNTGAEVVSAFVIPLWIYVKSALITLIATFVAHLALRGYWTALVGLSSVYPDGIRWEQVAQRSGPFMLAWLKERFGDIDATIERADNRATRVFGVGFAVATMMLIPIAMVLVLMAVMWAVTKTVGHVDHLLDAGFLLFMLLPVPFVVAVMIDRRRGASLPPEGRASRLIRGVQRVYQRYGLGQGNNPLLMLFSSHEGNRRTVAMLVLTMGLTFVMFALQAVGHRLGWEFGDFAGLPDDIRGAASLVLPAHYDSQRGDGVILVPVPSIPDTVVRGPYLRLFIPYFPRRHAESMRSACPEMLRDDAEPRARLACLQTLHAVAIDGTPVDVPFDAAEDPVTGQRGMLAMIPMTGIAPGRHELTVAPAPLDRERGEGAEPVEPYRIPFWR